MRRRGLALAAALAAAAATSACSTQRTLRIQSVPAGARVWVDGKDRGVTPVDVPFVHYGTVHVRLEKPGHAALAEDVRVATEIDGYPLIDLVPELTTRAKRWTWTGTLVPLDARPAPAALDGMLERAREFRERTHREVADPAAPGKAAAR